MSNSKRGNYYKRRTKLYFEKKGYHCEYMEQYKSFWNPKTATRGFIKRDLFGSDLLAVSKKEIIFVNSVFNKKQISNHIPEHENRFKTFPFPKSKQIKLMICIWKRGAREPINMEVDIDA